MSHLSRALDKLATKTGAVRLADLARVSRPVTHGSGHTFLLAVVETFIAALPADEDERPAALREIHDDLGPYADDYAQRVWEHESDHRAWTAWVDLHLYDVYDEGSTYSDPRDSDPDMSATSAAWGLLHDVASFLIQQLVDELIEADDQDRAEIEDPDAFPESAASIEARALALQAPYYMDNHVI